MVKFGTTETMWWWRRCRRRRRRRRWRWGRRRGFSNAASLIWIFVGFGCPTKQGKTRENAREKAIVILTEWAWKLKRVFTRSVLIFCIFAFSPVEWRWCFSNWMETNHLLIVDRWSYGRRKMWEKRWKLIGKLICHREADYPKQSAVSRENLWR